MTRWSLFLQTLSLLHHSLGLYSDRGIQDGSGQSTKWRRLYWIFLDVQRRDLCANRILDFIQSFLMPARFVGRNDELEAHRSELNTVLALAGFEYGADGKFRNRPAAATLTEAERRVKTIQAKFQGRRIHPEVLKYCQAELMQHNYFHAVFEASKGLAQRIRDKSGVDGDGAKLVDNVFSVNGPVLAFNTLQTEVDKTEHKGFTALPDSPPDMVGSCLVCFQGVSGCRPGVTHDMIGHRTGSRAPSLRVSAAVRCQLWLFSVRRRHGPAWQLGRVAYKPMLQAGSLCSIRLGSQRQYPLPRPEQQLV